MKWAWVGLVAFIAGCSGGTEQSGDKGISGTYTGQLSGASNTYTLSGTIGVAINQTNGTLSGSFNISETVTSSAQTLSGNYGGTLTGTYAPGLNPPVIITIHVAACPDYSATFSGTYDGATQQLTLTGHVDFFFDGCTIALVFNGTFVLSRASLS